MPRFRRRVFLRRILERRAEWGGRRGHCQPYEVVMRSAGGGPWGITGPGNGSPPMHRRNQTPLCGDPRTQDIVVR
jgi:hypothetical protein